MTEVRQVLPLVRPPANLSTRCRTCGGQRSTYGAGEWFLLRCDACGADTWAKPVTVVL